MGNQSAVCRFVLNYSSVKQHGQVDFISLSNKFKAWKGQKIFKIIPIPSISKEYIIPRLHKLCDIRRAHFMKAGLFLYKKLQKLQENKIEN